MTVFKVAITNSHLAVECLYTRNRNTWQVANALRGINADKIARPQMISSFRRPVKHPNISSKSDMLAAVRSLVPRSLGLTTSQDCGPGGSFRRWAYDWTSEKMLRIIIGRKQ